MKIVNYLDASLNLNNSHHKPYHKPDNKILYTHKDSNHPPSILKQMPTSIEKRISTLSFNETSFNKSKEIYQKGLEKSGYRQTLKYHPAKEIPAITNEIENEMLFGLTLHLVLLSKEKIGKHFLNLIKNLINLINCSTVTPSK